MSATSPPRDSNSSMVPGRGVTTQDDTSRMPIGLTSRNDSSSSISGQSGTRSPRLLPFQDEEYITRTRKGRFHFGVWNGIHLKTPFWMVALFLIGVSAATGHHVYYASLDNDQVGTESQQQWSLRFGSAFAHMTQIFLVASVGVSYSQWLWRTLIKTDISVDCLDSAFDADTAIISLLNRELLKKIKVGAFLAFTCWCLQLPSLITPATLTVLPTIRTSYGNHNVSSLDMYTGEQSRRFAVFVENEKSQLLFLGPRTVISRLVTATATEGVILPIQAPFPNSTYSVSFYGPAIKCETANQTIAAIIETLRNETQQAHAGNNTVIGNYYYGFVPNFKGLGDGTPDNGVRAVPQTRLQQPMDASNELWMVYARYKPGQEKIPNNLKIFDTVYTTCSLWNASYVVDLGFQQTEQNVTSRKRIELLNKVEYPEKESPMTQESNIQQAYSAVMWAISDLLVGQMVLFSTTDPSYGRARFGEINTQIAHTSLLGSSDLRVHFDQNRMFTTNTSIPSDQTLVDMNLAGNHTLPDLVEELAFNVTMSFMNSRLLSPNITANVTIKQSINTYSYSSRNLYIAYGLAILFALIANILGAYAFLDNKASHSRVFSAKVLTRKGAKLHEIVNQERFLKAPLNDNLKQMRIKFSVEKWAFVKVDGPTGRS